jgi:hypothetical protein
MTPRSRDVGSGDFLNDKNDTAGLASLAHQHCRCSS